MTQVPFRASPAAPTRRRRHPVLLASVAVLGTLLGAGALAQSDAPVDPMTHFVGKWSLTLEDGDGTVVGKATSHGYPVLDGTMVQIDYRSLDRAGNVVFRGTTLRTKNPNGGWIVRWAMSNVPGYTYITEEWRDGAIHGTGSGTDPGGDFLERYRYFDLSANGYSFKLERSLDGGQTWAPGPKAVAVRTE